MRMQFNVFGKKLFGAKYETMKRTLPVYLIVFWGVRTAGVKIAIAPFIMYLTVGGFTAGLMWQALSSEDNAGSLQNLFMLPFERRELVFSYVSALGAHTLLTKTAGLLAIILAVSTWSGMEIVGGILCGGNAVLMTACIYARKKYGSAAGLLWAGAILGTILFLWDSAAFVLLISGNILLAVLLLSGVDAYSFYPAGSRPRCLSHSGKGCLVWRYLLRYLTAHKNYSANTAAMWGVACVLPAFLGKMERTFVMPIGFAILSLNTPVSILLSSDPDLEQAVRFLPGQRRTFCLPYCLFLFLCNMTANAIFLASWQIQIGGADSPVIFMAAFFALAGSMGSVLLEWFCPLRGWKTQSDLWHHPRKYLVPAAMLLLAGAIGTMRQILPVR